MTNKKLKENLWRFICKESDKKKERGLRVIYNLIRVKNG